MQELNGEFASVLRDLVDFLECLSEVELPEVLQVTHESLLSRSKNILQQCPNAPDSPEPYLDMNAGKSLHLLRTGMGDEAEQPQEYIAADESQRGSLQHYYETFQDFSGNGANSKPKDCAKTEADKEMDDVVLLYASFTASQAKSRSAKSGSLLHLKRERKMFAPFNVFLQDRQCWVSLLGSHLLLFANERESRPYLVIPLRGYKSRPAPGALARDPRRSEGAFEIYCPGDRTFQFVAKTAQEMKEWVAAVTESLEPEECGGRSATRAATFAEILELESTERMCIERVKEEKEKYQDVLNSPKSKTKDKQPIAKPVTSEKDKEKSSEKALTVEEEAPPLPVRSRELPALPAQDRISYEVREEPYDEEGLYHRIEDIRAQREYQNCQARSSKKIDDSNAAKIDLIQETYDDVETVAVKRSRTEEPMETYDDVQSVMKSQEEPISYDDVQSIAEDIRAKSEKEKSPAKPLKSPMKLSFFDRVRNRKDSTKKDDKKSKSPTPPLASSPPPTSPTSTTSSSDNKANGNLELPSYDDVSNLISVNKEACSSPQGMEEEYLCPPPPRPIYSRPPTIIRCAITDEIYDDIGSCIEVNGNGCQGCAGVDVIKSYPEKNCSFLSDLQLSIDQEHYQVPKSNSRIILDHHQDELYDDVTLSATFKNRQRDSVTSCASPSVWSRLSGGRRPRFLDYVARQTSFSESSGTNGDGHAEHQNSVKVKPIQKLISKMETLGKTSKANGVTN
ncbi:uncharacterized protein LOC100121133 [Nasonia vitripennis]|uniref:PH domain-containing protein n=1 Tax=Nasonia vitripennis TaxID=7425 RepID=A0A7M7H7R1_NASVI|nr:uncharacterized protein LOC100121133 [Nasonia vitripennis]XP_008210900.1 uncharacterized protein LOC100121133 [Nasonia vitripennis]XP_008210901.1 uncharacterized protein LOC100121133 [Nasonia vitripennis]